MTSLPNWNDLALTQCLLAQVKERRKGERSKVTQGLGQLSKISQIVKFKGESLGKNKEPSDRLHSFYVKTDSSWSVAEKKK